MALATGAGKTITAIYGAVRLFEGLKEHGLFTIVSVPYQNLAEQWIDELSLFESRQYPVSKPSPTGRAHLKRAFVASSEGEQILYVALW